MYIVVLGLEVVIGWVWVISSLDGLRFRQFQVQTTLDLDCFGFGQLQVQVVSGLDHLGFRSFWVQTISDSIKLGLITIWVFSSFTVFELDLSWVRVVAGSGYFRSRSLHVWAVWGLDCWVRVFSNSNFFGFGSLTFFSQLNHIGVWSWTALCSFSSSIRFCNL